MPPGAPLDPDAALQGGRLLDRVYSTYLLMHTHQTVDFVRKKVRAPLGPPAAGGMPQPPTLHPTAAGPALVPHPSLPGGHPLPTRPQGGS